jgi:hypothetical protein
MQNLVVLLLPKEKKRTVLVEEEVKKITSGEWVGGRAPERAGRRAMQPNTGRRRALTDPWAVLCRPCRGHNAEQVWAEMPRRESLLDKCVNRNIFHDSAEQESNSTVPPSPSIPAESKYIGVVS